MGALDICIWLVDLVDRYDKRNTRFFDALKCFKRLCFHAVISSDDENRNVGDVSTACANGFEGRMARSIDEGDTAFAGLAGVLGGNAFVTEPGMAATVGSVIFVVVVVGGMGSLAGAFIASVLIGVVQTFAVAIDQSLVTVLSAWGVALKPSDWGYALWSLKLSQVAPILPYLLLVLMLIFRPRGLLGTREG